MRFTVIWKPRGEADLADLWNEATNRADITRAANAIDLQLRTSP